MNSAAPGRVTRRDALEIVDLCAKASTAYDRADLAKRLRYTRGRISDPSIRVLVVGEFKQGKSSLVNGLVLANVCPVDDDIATATPTVVRFGVEPSARAVFEPETGADPDADPPSETVAFDAIGSYVTEIRSDDDGARRLEMVEVAVPSPLLRSGLTIVDTPGVGGLGSPYTAVTIGALPLADAVIFVTDASQEFTKPELDFLRTAREMCPNMICVMTKHDLYPHWREIAQRNKDHLDRAGVKTQLLAVSSWLHQKAIESGDETLQDESGYPRLVEILRNEVVARAQRLANKAVAADLVSVTSQLEGQFGAERDALADPEAAQQLVRRLEDARSAADELRSKASRWQQTLSDGMSDLNSDVDFDLRNRIRNVTREAEEALDDVDPAESWDDYDVWLRQHVMASVAENYAGLHRGADRVSHEVAEHFIAGEEQIGSALRVETPADVISAVDLAKRDEEAWGAGSKAMHGMRSSYGGVLMFGMLGGLAGLSLINPATIAIGVLMGHKAIKDEKKRRLSQRQGQAKTAVRRYMDDVMFQVTTDSRNTLRKVQRQLRDYYSERADELSRSTREALESAQAAVNKDAGERKARLRDVEAELDRIRELRKRVHEFTKRISGDPGRGEVPAS